jgi:hypothetical protein
MRYRMPTYGLKGMVVAIASDKHNMSKYLDVDLVEKIKKQTEPLELWQELRVFQRHIRSPVGYHHRNFERNHLKTSGKIVLILLVQHSW